MPQCVDGEENERETQWAMRCVTFMLFIDVQLELQNYVRRCAPQMRILLNGFLNFYFNLVVVRCLPANKLRTALTQLQVNDDLPDEQWPWLESTTVFTVALLCATKNEIEFPGDSDRDSAPTTLFNIHRTDEQMLVGRIRIMKIDVKHCHISYWLKMYIGYVHRTTMPSFHLHLIKCFTVVRREYWRRRRRHTFTVFRYYRIALCLCVLVLLLLKWNQESCRSNRINAYIKNNKWCVVQSAAYAHNENTHKRNAKERWKEVMTIVPHSLATQHFRKKKIVKIILLEMEWIICASPEVKQMNGTNEMINLLFHFEQHPKVHIIHEI